MSHCIRTETISLFALLGRVSVASAEKHKLQNVPRYYA
ncbi:hypothetical protein V1280_008658 [Bradyrhizobium sp. AZCC 2230]